MRSKTVALLLSALGVAKSHSRPHADFGIDDRPFRTLLTTGRSFTLDSDPETVSFLLTGSDQCQTSLQEGLWFEDRQGT